MARAALTAATVLSMSSPALAHPSLENYIEDHTHEVQLPTLRRGIEAQIEHELEAEAREQWQTD